ncbi:MAG: dephospho-CoA kinase [Verrucomicrobia bacterium GWF2_51_19]|nr:MAG: dephospho-CoA kinase [Verrucomicrobia bacterium GWF2_51_19]HCJ11502.1 dephospho-CoA kinase [Opitutae bacterium]
MLIGLTGGVGCGKTTALGFFREAGFETINTDGVVRTLLESDTELIDALLKRWGASITTDGKIDRRKIAQRVFSKEEELDWLESQLHPRVRRFWESEVNQKPSAHWVIEIPLLFEKNLQDKFDFTICVIASKEVQELRLTPRQWTETEKQFRIERQFSLSKKMELSDFHLLNNGSFQDLKDQIAKLIPSLI